MGVGEDGKREVNGGDVGYDLSMNMCFVVVPFHVLFLFWKIVFRSALN